MKKVLTVIGAIVVVIIIIFVVLFVFTSLTSKKLECKSSEGNITIMYNDKTITGYTANGITYDMDGQQVVAEQMGIDAYINEFSTWFGNNTSGTCTKK